MIRRLLLIIVAILLGILCETAIWGKPITSSFPLFLSISLVLGWFALLLFDINSFPAPRSVLLFPLPVFFAYTASLNAGHGLSLKFVLSMGFTFLYLGLLAITYRGGQFNRYCLFDYLQNFSQLAISIIRRPAGFIWQSLQDIYRLFSGRAGGDRVSAKYGRTVAFLSFIALFGLFAVADSIFREFHSTLFGNAVDGIGDGQVNVFGVIFWSYIILGILLHAGTHSRDEHLAVDNPQAFRRWFNYNFSALVFIAVLAPLMIYNALRGFCIYNWMQCPGADGFPSLPDVHISFWVFIGVTAIVFLVVCWLNHVTVLEDRRDRLVHIGMNLLLYANILAITVIACVNVKTQTYGLDTIRKLWYARAGFIWLDLMFGMFIVYEYRERECDFPFAALVVTTILVGAYCFIGGLVNAL